MIGDGGLTGPLALALFLGWRHALDADHLAAVSQIVLHEGGASARRSGLVGLSWGVGHALTLCAIGLPAVLWGQRLPEEVRVGSEVAIGVLLIALAVRLLPHRSILQRRVLTRHTHGPSGPRSRSTAFCIGLVHGVGGSAAAGVLAVATVTGPAALAVLLLFSATTAASMATGAMTLGLVLGRKGAATALEAVLPLVAGAGVAFGLWYVWGAIGAGAISH
jgi:hypothetical protein